MKKENKKLAQEIRAKEREKNAKKAKITHCLKLWVPIIGVIVILIIVIAAIATSGSSDSSSADDYDYETDDGGELSLEDISESGSLNTTEGIAVQDGDTVNIDYTGYIDGEVFEGGSTDGYGTDLVIGSGSYISGFEEGIIGHLVGETFDLNLTFPEDYWNEDYAGKDVVFTTTVNGIYE